MPSLSLKELVDQIDKHNSSYYNDFVSRISDLEYDGLKDQLASQSKAFLSCEHKTKADIQLAERINDALTRIGAPPPADGNWLKAEHLVAMDSLNKVNTFEELDAWEKKCKH